MDILEPTHASAGTTFLASGYHVASCNSITTVEKMVGYYRVGTVDNVQHVKEPAGIRLVNIPVRSGSGYVIALTGCTLRPFDVVNCTVDSAMDIEWKHTYADIWQLSSKHDAVIKIQIPEHVEYITITVSLDVLSTQHKGGFNFWHDEIHISCVSTLPLLFNRLTKEKFLPITHSPLHNIFQTICLVTDATCPSNAPQLKDCGVFVHTIAPSDISTYLEHAWRLQHNILFLSDDVYMIQKHQALVVLGYKAENWDALVGLESNDSKTFAAGFHSSYLHVLLEYIRTNSDSKSSVSLSHLLTLAKTTQHIPFVQIKDNVVSTTNPSATVGIVIPVCSYCPFIADSIRSLLVSYRHLEICAVFADESSIDASMVAFAHEDRVKIVSSSCHREPLNFASMVTCGSFELTRSKIIVILTPSLIFCRDFIQNVITSHVTRHVVRYRALEFKSKKNYTQLQDGKGLSIESKFSQSTLQRAMETYQRAHPFLTINKKPAEIISTNLGRRVLLNVPKAVANYVQLKDYLEHRRLAASPQYPRTVVFPTALQDANAIAGVDASVIASSTTISQCDSGLP